MTEGRLATWAVAAETSASVDMVHSQQTAKTTLVRLRFISPGVVRQSIASSAFNSAIRGVLKPRSFCVDEKGSPQSQAGGSLILVNTVGTGQAAWRSGSTTWRPPACKMSGSVRQVPSRIDDRGRRRPPHWWSIWTFRPSVRPNSFRGFPECRVARPPAAAPSAGGLLGARYVRPSACCFPALVSERTALRSDTCCSRPATADLSGSTALRATLSRPTMGFGMLATGAIGPRFSSTGSDSIFRRP
jgi:hypothetical protein